MDELTYKTALHVIEDAEKKLHSLGRDLAHESFRKDQDPFGVTYLRGTENNGGTETVFGSKKVIALQIAHFLDTHKEIDYLVALIRLSNTKEECTCEE